MFKNTASKLTVYVFDATTNLPKTGDAANLTAYVDKDDAGVNVLTDTSATEKDSTNAKGFYIFDLAQAETNADKLLFTCKSSTANMVCLAMPAVVYTLPATGILAPATAGRTLVVDAAGLADANAVKIGPTGSGTALTARDIGLSVLLSSGTGTGQVKLASGYIAPNWGDVGNPTTTLNLSGTNIKTDQKVDVETIKTNPVANGGTVTFPTNKTLAATDNITAGTMTTVTNLTNAPTNGDLTATMKTSVTTAATAATPTVTAGTVSDKTGYGLADGAITAAKIADGALTAAKFAAGAFDAVWTVTARVLTAATNMVLPSNALSAISAWTVAITGNITGNLSGSVGSLTGHTNQTGDAYAIVNSGTHGNAALKTLIDAVDNFVDTEVAAILAAVDTEVAAILADTNDIQTRLPAALTGSGNMAIDPVEVELSEEAIDDIAEGVIEGVGDGLLDSIKGDGYDETTDNLEQISRKLSGGFGWPTATQAVLGHDIRIYAGAATKVLANVRIGSLRYDGDGYSAVSATADADWPDGDIELTQELTDDSTATGYWYADMPAGTPAGQLSVDHWVDPTDDITGPGVQPTATQYMYWTGSRSFVLGTPPEAIDLSWLALEAEECHEIHEKVSTASVNCALVCTDILGDGETLYGAPSFTSDPVGLVFSYEGVNSVAMTLNNSVVAIGAGALFTVGGGAGTGSIYDIEISFRTSSNPSQVDTRIMKLQVV